MSRQHKSTHIVVTGYSRSGTTMFYNMLRTSVANYEFMDHEYPAALAVRIDNRSRITKRPLDIFCLDSIQADNKYDKNLYLLICIRDIRSLVTSFHKSVPDDYFIGYDYQYFISRDGQFSYTNPGIIATHNAILNALQSQYFQKKILIKYEDMLKNPKDLQDLLAKEIGFEYKDNFENFYKKSIPPELLGPLNTVRPIDTTRIESWKNTKHFQRIKSQFTRCPDLFDILIQYGYEKDRSWYEEFKQSFSST
jgi:hypothetical protein